MAQPQIFITLPVRDVPRTLAFFKRLGFEFDPQFTGEQSACMLIAENIRAMFGATAMFQTLTTRRVADATQTAQVLITISRDSREAVDSMVAAVKAAGGTVPDGPEDHGFMYAQGFYDLDGHGWNLAYMVPGAEVQA